MNWKTKPTDRFVLKFIKIHISAPISLLLVRLLPDIKPAVLTFLAAGLGISGGIAFGVGFAWLGALMAALAQILDGTDGQVARLTDRVSSTGALLDSVLDRYMDFSLIFGILFHCLRYSSGVGWGETVLSPVWLIVIAGLAAVGSSQVSYATARAASLNLAFSRPEYAGKGSRTTVIIICGLLTPFWIHFPLVALLYLAIHPNIAVILSIVKSRDRQTHAGNGLD
jgi:phosphatidylglycerophosphate synthase